MKKLLAFAVLLIVALCAIDAVDLGDMAIHIDGEDYGGPLGILLGLVFGSLGVAIAAIVIVCTAVFVGVLFAGIGIMLVAGLALLAVVVLALIAPFLLPLLIPVAVVCYLAARGRRHGAPDPQRHAV